MQAIKPKFKRFTEDCIFMTMEDGTTRFGIGFDGSFQSLMVVPKAIHLPLGLGDEAFDEFIYALLKPGAWKVAQ